MDHGKIFKGCPDAMMDTFLEKWSEGESYWLPFVQTLRFNEIQVPKHLEDDFVESVNFQEFLTPINDSAGELRKSCELFLGPPFRFSKPQVNRIEDKGKSLLINTVIVFP